ncbi:hypothetical protein K4A83_05015 [Spirulina subsalsa FACHB-351]|uniref:Uncharacterized protein n=1 Tax=Spirulina subsalsa FACHB-351 TaxID=234711 RepID=A0ABT3L2C8_9CYAN|nr:hypothetical protein [Spirulina subsalsa]MCW6035633.1 hypothetical protein [Spirulina subsalsa FACHB-351]
MKKSLPEQMIELMSDGAWHSTEELVKKISHRFSATMHILRKRGYKFDTRRRLEDQQHEYRLVIESRVII